MREKHKEARAQYPTNVNLATNQKLYEGVAATRKVYVTPKDGSRYELEHHERHSPDGFSWGYLGSGCAELARCILWDFLGSEPPPALYQKFKLDYIAHFRMDQNWMFGSESIEMWLEDIQRRDPSEPDDPDIDDPDRESNARLYERLFEGGES